MSDYRYDIPPDGTEWPAEALNMDHPYYTANKSIWEYCRHAHELTGGYAKRVLPYNGSTPDYSQAYTYIEPHEKELEKDDDTTMPKQSYWRRAGQARPMQDVQTGISFMAGSLLSSEIITEYPPAIENWTYLVDLSQHSLDTWREQLVRYSLRYGEMYIFAHRPPTTAKTELEYRQQNLPLVVLDLLSPEVVRAWEKDQYNQYIWIRYVEEITDSAGPLSNTITTKRHWYINRNGCWYVDEGRKSTDKCYTGGATYWGNISYVPVTYVKMPHNPTYPAACAQQEAYNTSSELRRLHKDTCFAMTWLPIENALDNPSETIHGTDTIGTYPAGGSPPTLLSPPSDPFNKLTEHVKDLKAEIYACYGAAEVQGANSAIQLVIIEGLASRLYKPFSFNFEAAEKDFIAIVGDLMGSPANNSRCYWPKSYSVLEATQVVADVKSLIDLGVSDTAEKAARDKAIGAVLPGLSAEQWDNIDKEDKDKLSKDVQNPVIPSPPANPIDTEEVLDPTVGEGVI